MSIGAMATNLKNECFVFGDNPDKVSMSDFALIKVLGRGAYGKVFLVRKIGGKDNQCYYAMKILKKERLIERQKSLEHVLMERTVLEKLCSSDFPFIVHLIYAFQSDTKLHLVMDYVPGGELFSHLCKRRFFPVESARVLLGELALALKFIHSHNIVYRDLKLENIMIDQQGHIKLTDFGLSKAYKEEMDKTNSYCGTVEYMAPEVVKRIPYTKAVDWWSFGVIAFELLTGCSPFTVDGNRNSAPEVAKRVLTKQIPFPKNMDLVCRSLIGALLERDPEKRLGNNGFEEIKNHEFFNGLDWDLLEKRKLDTSIHPVIQGQTDTNNFAIEFTKLKPILTPADCPSSLFQDLFRGYSYVPPNVFFDKNNAIGEEIMDTGIEDLTKSSPFFAKYELCMEEDGFLGRGTFSVCRKCRRIEDGKYFAVKIVSQRFAHHALREIRILELVNPHKNIVKFEEALSDPLHYYLVMELLEGGELLQRLRKMNTFTEANACKLMNQLVSAVSHIHRKLAVHRDLKPENIIFANNDEDLLKLVDFGFARLLPNNSIDLNTPCFTLEYAAPEVLEIEDELPQYNEQCDLWSLGVILFTMLSGKVPFNARSSNLTANEIILKIKTAEFSFDDPVWDSVSDSAKDLITGLLTVDPKKRLKIGQLIRHPWLRECSDGHIRELQTPTILPEIDERFNETMNAFVEAMTRNDLSFNLMEVDKAPLLTKRRGIKGRGESVTKKRSISGSNGTNCGSSKVPTKLKAVPEDNNESIPIRRPTHLDIEMRCEDSPNDTDRAFTEIRDTKPDDLKFSQDQQKPNLS